MIIIQYKINKNKVVGFSFILLAKCRTEAVNAEKKDETGKV